MDMAEGPAGIQDRIDEVLFFNVHVEQIGEHLNPRMAYPRGDLDRLPNCIEERRFVPIQWLKEERGR